MSINWVSIAQAVALLLGGLGAGQIIQAFFKRKVTRVEAADRLNESTLEWAEQLKTDALEARKEAAEARTEATEARRELAEVRRQVHAVSLEAQQVAGYLAQIIRWIQTPDMSMDRLRELVSQVPPNPPFNGPARMQP